MTASPQYPLRRIVLFWFGLVTVCLGCGDDPTDPIGGGNGQEPIPSLPELKVAEFQVRFGPGAQSLADQEKEFWDPGHDPISPEVAGLQVEVRDVEEVVAPVTRARTLTGFWRLTDVAGQVRYLPRCRVDSLGPGVSVSLEGDFLALLPDSSTAWRPWQFEVPEGEALGFCFEVSWSSTVVAYHISADSTHGKAQVYLSDPADSRRAQLTHDDSDNTSPQVSPDGTTILFLSTRSSFLRQTQVWSLKADGSGLFRVIFNFTVNEWPRWSPDGTQIVYQKLVEDKWHIALMDADGMNRIDLSDEIAGDFYPAFSADGTKIIFRSNRQGPGLYIMNRDGSNKRKWLDYPVYDAVWSPDGERLAFRAGLEDIYVFKVDGGSMLNLTSQADGIVYRYPAWSPDGHRILVEGQTVDGKVDIYRINRDGTDLVRLIHRDTVTCHLPNWGPLF